MDKQNLIELGLGKSEAEIYIALTRIGKATSTDLTKETGIHRTYIYDVLEKLREKGLASQIKEDGKQYFLATEPERLKDYLKEKIEIADKIIPELNSLRRNKLEETNIEVYKGKEGIKLILNDMVKEGKNYLAFGVVHYFEDERYLSKLFTDQWILKMNEKKIREKLILEKGRHLTPLNLSESKFLPKEYLFLSSFIVYGDKVAIFIWEEPLIQIIVKNKNVAQSYISQFNALWKIARKS